MSNSPDLWRPDLNQSPSSGEAPQYEPIASTPADETAFLRWDASEYVHHEKDGLWFAGVIVGGLLLVVVSWVVLRSLSFTLLSVVMIATVLVLAVRPPRSIAYSLTAESIHIDDKAYRYDEFRSFGVLQDGGVEALQLLPVKKLRPAVSIYFPPSEGQRIVEIIGDRVPMIELKPDLIDKISRKLRF